MCKLMTSTERTKWIDEIFDFDMSKYHKTRVEIKTFSFKIIEENI